MNKARMKFTLQSGGILPLKETVITLEESEYIEDYYLVAKTDVNGMLDGMDLSIQKYDPMYINWLEEQVKD